MSEGANDLNTSAGEVLDELVLLEVLRQLRHDAAMLVTLRVRTTRRPRSAAVACKRRPAARCGACRRSVQTDTC